MSTKQGRSGYIRLLPMIPLRLLCLVLFLFAFSALPGIFELIDSSPYHDLYSNKEARAADHTLSHALAGKIGDLQMSFGVYPEAKVAIYIVYGADEYKLLSSGKAAIVEFSDAFYSGNERAIYARSKDQVLDNHLKILVHEYIHWYIEELFTAAPLWFHEGMATYFSQQLGYERYLIYLKESLINPHSDLFRMGYRYPEHREDWPRFYLSSAMAVRYMQDRYPLQWQRFWESVARDKRSGKRSTFSTCFVNSYQMSLWDFHKKFGIYSKRQGYFYLIVALNSLIFAILPFAMFAIARKRRHRLLALPDLPLQDEDSEAEDPDRT